MLTQLSALPFRWRMQYSSTCRLSVGKHFRLQLHVDNILSWSSAWGILGFDTNELVIYNYFVLQGQQHSIVCSCKYVFLWEVHLRSSFFVQIRHRKSEEKAKSNQLIRIAPKRKLGRPRVMGPALSLPNNIPISNKYQHHSITFYFKYILNNDEVTAPKKIETALTAIFFNAPVATFPALDETILRWKRFFGVFRCAD